jgi:DNA (cytosine-5)-methyltransferase 1
MRKLRALDLFCGAGGASKGLMNAGFHVTGVDHNPQKNYCGDVFEQGDALNLPIVALQNFDFIWASPPCQANVRGLKNSPGYGEHHDVIPETRDKLKRSGAHYCIENVPGAPLNVTLKLGGWMFPELKVIRERWFETSFLCMAPGHEKPRGLLHKGYLSIAGTGIQKWCADRGYRFNAQDARKAMGIDWMTRKELSQAIPPAYSEWIGRAAINAMRQAA